MVSTDIDGEPILILSLRDVKIIHGMLDSPETPDQDRVKTRILEFINDKACLEWEKRCAD
jgi:hypothetical protein